MRIRIPYGNAKQLVTCGVKTDHPTLPEWKYQMQFESFSNRISPNRIDLGTYSVVADHTEKPLTIRSRMEAWLELYALNEESLPAPTDVSVPSGLLVELDDEGKRERLMGGVWRARYRLSVALEDADVPLGLGSQPITVTLRDSDPIQAMVTWQFVGPVIWAPAAIHFGLLSSSDLPKTSTVLVKSADNQLFELISVDVGPYLELTGTSHGFNTLHKIEIALVNLPDDSSRVLSGEVKIRTKSGSVPEIRIPWSAFLRENTQ